VYLAKGKEEFVKLETAPVNNTKEKRELLLANTQKSNERGAFFLDVLNKNSVKVVTRTAPRNRRKDSTTHRIMSVCLFQSLAKKRWN